MKKFLLTGVALGFAAVLSATSALADITIGVAGPITGQYAAFGEQLKQGAEQAVADINAAGGVNGEKLVLEIGDDACDPKQAVNVANQHGRQGHQVHGRPLLLGLLDPGLARSTRKKASCRSRPASTNPSLHRRRPAGTSPASAAVTTRRASSPATSSPRTMPARRSPSSTTSRPTARASPTRPARRSTPPA